MEIIQKITWVITWLVITNYVAFFLWLDAWFKITIRFECFILFAFSLNRFITSVFFFGETNISFIWKNYYKDKKIRQGKTQKPHGDTELGKPETQPN